MSKFHCISAFKGRHFTGIIILWAMRWYAFVANNKLAHFRSTLIKYFRIKPSPH
ncbi:hypothetical protein [Providencia rettgeri]|uniref:hypothetical protein n=1 Tax=Providencia rettgeri TaxID=587 RepID=UPI00301725D0